MSLLKLCPTWRPLPQFFPVFWLERIYVLIFRLLLLYLFPNEMFFITHWFLPGHSSWVHPWAVFFLTGADLDLSHYTVAVTTTQVSSFWDSFFNPDLPSLLLCSFCTSAPNTFHIFTKSCVFDPEPFLANLLLINHFCACFADFFFVILHCLNLQRCQLVNLGVVDDCGW